MRPYLAAFTSRFLLMMQYRAAALAGFTTQMWWGGVRVMAFAAFYANAGPGAASAPLSLAQAITYTWMGQGLFALIPWAPDPDITAAVRNGAVAYDRLRPVNTYGFWYARTAGWTIARVVPRMALMAAAAGVGLPMLGLGDWAWRAPAGAAAGALFTLSFCLAVALSCAVTMLVNLVVAATLNARGITILVNPLVIVLSGSLLPLALYPDALRTFFLLQPLAGILDIPSRIYFGAMTGELAWAGIGLQLFWIVALVLGGRLWLGRIMDRLQVQGG